MTVHLLKLSAGAASVEELVRRVKVRVAQNNGGPFGPVHSHITRMFPRRSEELKSGGSVYWVIRGVVLVRQCILDLQMVTGSDGIDRCAILLDPRLVETEAQPRRAFQGWRYLSEEDAPADLTDGRRGPPPALRAELAALGLL